MRVQALRNGGVIVEVGASFDSGQLEELTRMLAPLRPIRHLVVDLAAARGIEDCALAGLARALGRVGASVSFRGLSRHQQRMLRYLERGEVGTPAEGEREGRSQGWREGVILRGEEQA